MVPDVITFVITIPVYGQCLETIKFAIFYRVFQGSDWSTASNHDGKNRPESAKTRGSVRKGFQDKPEFETGTSGFGSTA
jgi:hypothetical protein